MTWVEGAAGWRWWVFVGLCMTVGFAIGWAACRIYMASLANQLVDEAQEAARVYWREIERAKRRHPAHMEVDR